jgi:hypothetical protein
VRPTLSQRDYEQLTGCTRIVDDEGEGFVYDSLGRDQPPDNWPYLRPSKLEAEAALVEREEKRTRELRKAS